MTRWIFLAVIAGVFIWRSTHAFRAWSDAHKRGLSLLKSLWYAILALIDEDAYWWDARLRIASPKEREELLHQAASSLGLEHIANLRCPLCGHEIHNALSASRKGQLRAARHNVQCPHCDFRLDSCRHCAHFLPGDQGPTATGIGYVAIPSPLNNVSGRCSVYREWRPVSEVCAPHVATRLARIGMERVRAPTRIVDSYIPLDYCKAFELKESLLKKTGIPRITRRQRRLLRFLAEEVKLTKDQGELTEEEKWLL